MRFRPCIDIHNGKVKQIIGGTLCDRGDSAAENFVSGKSAADYARMYAADRLAGGHVILLNPVTSPFYETTREQALSALQAAPGLLQIGGGMTPETAGVFLEAGADRVIVTSYVFRGGVIDYEALERMVRAVGKRRLVLDLSARRRDGVSYVVTDRWQKFTNEALDVALLQTLSAFCSEFLVHAVDVEGSRSGPDEELLATLGRYAALPQALPVTYAGGIGSLEDIQLIERAGSGLVDFTVGSALDLFGGAIPYRVLAEQYSGDVLA